MKKCILLLLVIIMNFSNNSWASHGKRIKLYAFCTPSHEILRDEYFLPSIQDDYEVIIENGPQECPKGMYGSLGWLNTMSRKMDLIIRAIEENWGDFFIVSDLDIQFFAPTENIIRGLMGADKDMVIQKDTPSGVLCAGFMVIRANEKTYNLWRGIKKRMFGNIQKRIHDQKALNDLLIKENPFNVSWDYLPDYFFGGGTLTGHGWSPGKLLPIPENIVMHHANWTMGIKNKIAQLCYVKSEVEKMHKNRLGNSCSL